MKIALCVLLSLAWLCDISRGEEQEERAAPERDIVVNGEADEGEHDQFSELGEYGQPAWAERNYASATTAVYVLSPWEASANVFFEWDAARHGNSIGQFVQEIDMGLLHRFELGFENQVGIVGDSGHDAAGVFEIRYAFADWNKLPLNPALSFEYVAGWGRAVESSGHEARRHREHLQNRPDEAVVRLLLGRSFGDQLGYALNFALGQDTFDNGGKLELTQCLTRGLMQGVFEVGAEMRYVHSTQDYLAHEKDNLTVGPTVTWKPTRQTRFNVAPLAGCTNESPRLAILAMFSYEFGGAEAIVPESGAGAHK